MCNDKIVNRFRGHILNPPGHDRKAVARYAEPLVQRLRHDGAGLDAGHRRTTPAGPNDLAPAPSAGIQHTVAGPDQAVVARLGVVDRAQRVRLGQRVVAPGDVFILGGGIIHSAKHAHKSFV